MAARGEKEDRSFSLGTYCRQEGFVGDGYLGVWPKAGDGEELDTAKRERT
jgi:hypothetical protein